MASNIFWLWLGSLKYIYESFIFDVSICGKRYEVVMYSVVFFGYLDPDVLSYAESSQLPLPEETPSSSVPAQHEAAGMAISKTESRDLGLAMVFKWIMVMGGMWRDRDTLGASNLISPLGSMD